MAFTLHIATDGLAVPLEHNGSNPVGIASDYRLGPQVLDTFSVEMTPRDGRLHYSQLFVNTKNPFMTVFHASQFSVVTSALPVNKSPDNLVVRIGGVSYKVPPAIARRVKGKRADTIFWQATVGLGIVFDSGDFRFWRDAPGVS